MYLIGLTGNIACGKSTVARQLAALGAAVSDADQVAHAAMAPGGPAYASVAAAFPDVIPGPGQPINRARLGGRVFGDPAALRRLEELVHPAVRAAIHDWLAAQRQAGRAVAVIEAIKLIEGGYPAICDAVWVVTCERAQQIARLVETRGLTPAQAAARIAAQGPSAAKLARADVVIDTTGDLAATARQVAAAWAAIGPPAAANPPVDR